MEEDECNKWKQCCYTAQACCSGMLQQQHQQGSMMQIAFVPYQTSGMNNCCHWNDCYGININVICEYESKYKYECECECEYGYEYEYEYAKC